MRSTCSFIIHLPGKMATFNAKVFEKKLRDMDLSQTSVQTVSLWIIHHKQNIKEILSVWIEQIKKVKPDRRIVLFYLANDVVQNSRKKAKELVLFFGKAFKEALPYLNDKKINGQVERVFKIWDERRVYDKDFLDKLRSLHANGKKEKEKNKTKDDRSTKHGDKSGAKLLEKQEEKSTKPKAINRPLPADFKMSAVMNMIVSMKELESEISKQDNQMASLRVDASDLEAVKQVKDRSGVNKFVKQFEESREKLDVYCNTLSRSINDKRSLVEMLYHSETYYDAAYEEAKVIVHAYKTFGSRLTSMRRKVESRVKKLETAWKKKQKEIEERKASQPEYELEPISDAEEPNEFQPIDVLLNRAKDEMYRPEDPTLDNVNVLDMDLESDSDVEIPDGPLYDPSSVQYDPNDADQPLESSNKGDQSNLVSEIHIPNPEDVFKNLVGQVSSETISIGQSSLANTASDVTTSMIGQGNPSGPVLQQPSIFEGEQLIMSIPSVKMNTLITTAVPSLTIATESLGTMIDNSALSPISDDSVPSPEGTPDGLVLDKTNPATVTSLSMISIPHPEPLTSALHPPPLMTSMPVTGTYTAGEHIGTVSVNDLYTVNTVDQMQHLNPGVSDWSLPSSLQSLPSLPTPLSLSANMNIAMSFSTNNVIAPNDSIDPFIVASDGTVPQQGMLPSVATSQNFKKDGTGVSTPTQDETPEKSVRPIDIISQLLTRGKQRKDEADSATDDEKSATDHSSKKSREHSRSSSRRNSSGKRRSSSHRHHSSNHKESSYDHSDSTHSSSRNKDRSHSSHRRTRSRSKSKEDVLHFEGSDEEIAGTYMDQSEDSMFVSSKIARLESIAEMQNNLEQNFNNDNPEDRITISEQAYGQENVLIDDSLQIRQPTIFDLRRNEMPQDIISQDIPNKNTLWSSSDDTVDKAAEKMQFSDSNLALGAKNGTADAPVFVSQESYQETAVKITGTTDKLANIGRESLSIDRHGSAVAGNESSGYFYNTRRSPTPEMDVPDLARSTQPNQHYVVDLNSQQLQFSKVSSTQQQSSIADTIPIPQFALDLRQQLGPNFPTRPLEEPLMSLNNFNAEPALPPPSLEQPHFSEQHRSPLQPGNIFRPTLQPDRPSLQPEHPFMQPDRLPFQPTGPQFPSDQQMFLPGESVINADINTFKTTEMNIRPPSESAINSGPRMVSSNPMLPPRRPSFHNDTSLFRQERPHTFRAETPHFRSERPMFRGQRPNLRQSRPSAPRSHDELQRNQMIYHQGIVRTTLPGSQGNESEFQADVIETDTMKYNQSFDQNLNYNTDNSIDGGNIHDDMPSVDQNIMKEDNRLLNGPLHSSGMVNHMHLRQQRPNVGQHGFHPGNFSHPNNMRMHGRFRSRSPGILRGNRPLNRPGSGDLMFRPRFRPPLRPRFPQTFPPRRPVL